MTLALDRVVRVLRAWLDDAKDAQKREADDDDASPASSHAAAALVAVEQVGGGRGRGAGLRER